MMSNVFYRACQEALIQILKYDGTLIPLDYYRDMTLWMILHAFQHLSSYGKICHSVTSIPLVFLATPIDTVRLYILACLRNEISRSAERQLILSLDETSTLSLCVEKKVKKKNKKKKRIAKKNATSLPNQKLDDNKNVDLGLEEKPTIFTEIPSEPVTLERSRNTILVMSLLEDIIESVFASSDIVDVMEDQERTCEKLCPIILM